MRLLTCVAASNLPDLDRLALVGLGPLGRASPLHSLLGAAALAALVGWFASAFAPKEARGRIRLLAAAGVGLHLFLDGLTVQGLPLLWPLFGQLYGLGWLHTTDVWLLLLLSAPLLHAFWQERRRGVADARVSTAAILVSLYAAICGVSKGRALQATLNEMEATAGRPIEVQAYPAPYGPLLWTTVVRTDAQVWHRGVVSALTGGVTPAGTYPTGAADPRMQVALATVQGAAYGDDARALFLAHVSDLEADGSFEVGLGDLRFSNPFSDRIPWVLWLRIGPDFNPEGWAFVAAPHLER